MKKKKTKIFNLLLTCWCVAVALLGLWGCHGGRSERLRAIDAIMEDDPALAFAQLDSVDRSTLSEADYPYYCLLYTQAQVKNNIALDNDSLIRVAYEAYADCSDADLRRRANFYSAQVAYYAKDYRTAMRDILPAYEIAKEANDPYWTAKAAEIIGDIYFDVYNYGKAAEFTREAADNYKEAGKTLNHRYALSDLSSTLINCGRTKEAVELIDSLRQVILSEEPLDAGLFEYTKLAFSAACYKSGRFDELHNLIEEGFNMELSNETKTDLTVIAINSNDQMDSGLDAETLLLSANNIAPSEKERIRVKYAEYLHALNQKDFKRAAALSDTLLRMQSIISKSVLNESVANVQSDYFSRKADVQEHRWHTLLIILICIVAIAAVITVALMVIHRYRMKAKENELDAIMTSLYSSETLVREAEEENVRLASQIDQQKKIVGELRDELAANTHYDENFDEILENLYRTKWETLNLLCTEYYEKWGNEQLHSSILKKLRKEISTQASPDRVAEIEESVNKYMDGVMKLIREDFSYFKEEDFNILSLSLAGFTYRTICLFLNLKRENFYKQRQRLITRIEQSDSPHKEFIMNKVGKVIKQKRQSI